MSSKSLAVSMFSGLRVAGELQYIPGYIRPGDGKEIQSRTIIPVYENTARADGAGNSISHQFRLTAWGALADICAKALPKGKEFSAVCSPRQYKGRVFYSNMQPVNDIGGTPLMTNKVSFNIDEISFGADSRDFLTLEIAEKRRGAQWDVPGTQDHANWLARVAEIKALQHVPGNLTFGYAKVLPPSGAVAATQPNPTDVNNTFGGANNGAAAGAQGDIPAGYVVNAAGQIVPAETQAAAVGTTGAIPLF